MCTVQTSAYIVLVAAVHACVLRCASYCYSHPWCTFGAVLGLQCWVNLLLSCRGRIDEWRRSRERPASSPKKKKTQTIRPAGHSRPSHLWLCFRLSSIFFLLSPGRLGPCGLPPGPFRRTGEAELLRNCGWGRPAVDHGHRVLEGRPVSHSWSAPPVLSSPLLSWMFSFLFPPLSLLLLLLLLSLLLSLSRPFFLLRACLPTVRSLARVVCLDVIVVLALHPAFSRHLLWLVR